MSQTVRCPYNPAHVMAPESLLRHLYKCTATNKHQFAQCRYNQLHVIPKDCINDHYKLCPDFKKKDKYEEDDDWDIEESRVQDWDNQDKQQRPKISNQRGNNAPATTEGKYKKKNSWSNDSDEDDNNFYTQQKTANNKNNKSSSKQQQPFKCDQSRIQKKKPIVDDF